MPENQEQKEFWSAQVGQKWAEQQAAMDALLLPVLERLLNIADLQVGARVLDIGCGAGSSTRRAAEIVGQQGHCTGLDISDTLLGVAQRDHAPNLQWLLADAQTHAFAPESYDAIISRFGVMFFEDNLAAFTNLRAALKAQGRLVMAAWGAAHLNPWFMLPAQVARAHLGEMPKVDRSLPGPFAFENEDRVVEILSQTGWEDVRVDSALIHLNGGHSAQDAARLCCEVGSAAGALRHFEADQSQKEAITADLAVQFQDFMTDEGLLIPAYIHFYSARGA